MLTREFDVDWLKVTFLGRLKLQLGSVLSLGFLTWGLNINESIWACGFLFNEVKQGGVGAISHRVIKVDLWMRWYFSRDLVEVKGQAMMIYREGIF